MNKDDWVCPWADVPDHIEIQNTTDFFEASGSTPTELKSEYEEKITKREGIVVFLNDVGALDIDECTDILKRITDPTQNRGGDNR